MAYENESKRVLASKARLYLNAAENSIQAGMRRLDELERRYAAEAANTTPVPVANTVPTPPVANTTPTPPVANTVPTPPANTTPVVGFSDFKFEDELIAGWPNSKTNDGLPDGGAFRLFGNICKFGLFDPIVYPNQDKKGHLHMFFGNDTINFDSTFESLSAKGHNSVSGDNINRSGYWTPALLFGDNAWVPEHIKVYYKMPPKEQEHDLWPNQTQKPRRHGVPNGLKMVFGNMMDLSGEVNHVRYSLADDLSETNNIFSSNPADILSKLKPGKVFTISLGAPYLWNGELDSPDHRSHLSYPVWDNDLRRSVAPAGFDKIIPQISYIIQWIVPDGVDANTLRCSSDMPGQYPLSNFHADYFAVWHPLALIMMFDSVFQRNVSTSHADFANGKRGKDPSVMSFQNGPKLIPIAHSETGHVHGPATGVDVLASTVKRIESNFDITPWIQGQSFQNDDGRERNASAHPDVVGAFRFDFNISHYSYNDPIVYPKQPGKAHLHEHWGNSNLDHSSTYESLRRSGNGTTNGGPLNRSGYWKPPILLGDQIAVPKNGTMYYKRLGKPEFLTFEKMRPHFKSTVSDAEVRSIADAALALNKKHMPVNATLSEIPAGLRLISPGGKLVVRKQDGRVFEAWYQPNNPWGAVNSTMSFEEVLAKIEPGDNIDHVLELQNAWDGLRVDSPDHMSHMSIPKWDGNLGAWKMPDTHKYLIPSVTVIAHYVALPGEDWTKAELSSDRMMSARPFSTSHWDYWEAWDDNMRRESHQYAMDQLLNCSGGDMGNGRALARHFNHSFDFPVKRVPISSVPTNGGLYFVSDAPIIRSW